MLMQDTTDFSPAHWRRSLIAALVCGTLVSIPVLSAAASTHGKAEHIVVVVWDGMRPDFVSAQHTPNLDQLRRQGVFFNRHHPVFVSTTEVNGSALATGMYPDHTGILANKLYRPELNWLEAAATENLEIIRRGDLLSHGHYLFSPTLAEILQKAGERTIVAGTKPVVLLLDRSNQRGSLAERGSVNLFQGHSLPASALADIVATDGEQFPTNVTYPNVKEDAWTTKSLTESLWKTGVPKLSFLWLSDPDFSQHDSGPGSTKSLAALESSDRNLGAVLAALDAKNVRDKTDVFVVSDHGFSTINYAPDIALILRHAGFRATRKLSDPEAGEVLVVGLGGSDLFYVVDHDETVVRRLTEFLQTTDFAGVIFSRTKLPGTFPLEQIRSEATYAPDLLVALRWSPEKSATGAPGMITSDAGKVGKGTHGSLSPYDMHNTLVGAGPDLRPGFVDESPSGNADLAPTILWILGIAQPKPMDGRILGEALRTGVFSAPTARSQTVEAKNESTAIHWRQHLTFTTIGHSIYFDEGNGEATSPH